MDRLSEDRQRVVRATHLLADSKFDEGDYESAFMLYEGVHEHDLSGFSFYRLGLMYFKGYGIEADPERAEILFNRAWLMLNKTDNSDGSYTVQNNQEDPCVQFALGNMCELCLHTCADQKKATWHYEQAAKKGHVGAQTALAWLYYNGIKKCEEYVIRADKHEAVKYFRMAAQQGNLDAQAQLGYMYFMAEGGIGPDKTEAFKLYQDAANKGNALAQFRLGTLYFYGRGVSEDRNEAVRLYKMSAEQGNPKAQAELAGLYERGEVVTRNLQKAVELYKLAADQGDVEALYHYGLMSRNGIGMEPNIDEAERLLNLAAKKGHVRAHTQSQKIAKKKSKASRASGCTSI
eukprot:TRINITY_DN567_c0_g2_i1.p1 TRINITY_DN567_c0_g2~~TRINITY_DN567_c0_g2_i1.p1  ORF type:complete len:390 (-),score=52.22 TRINITY_DN567_c0_g2_i1:64-1104(-)